MNDASAERIRVPPADDPATVRRLRRRTLESPDLDVAGEASEGAEVVALAGGVHPDQLGAAFEHAPGAMALVDGGDRLLHANAAWSRLSGYTTDELRRLRLADLAVAEDQEAWAAARTAACGGAGAAPPVEVRLLRADGQVVPVLLACSALPATDEPANAGGPAATGDPGATGHPGGRLLVQLTDITEQKRQQAALRRSNAELSSFAFLAAHELKSPLQAMSGFAGLLDQVHGPAMDPQAREFLGWILDGARRMDALIEDLLAYCSVDTAEAVLVEVGLHDVLAGAMAELECEVSSRRAVVQAGALPVVLGDPTQLGQLVRNLLANALKFVPDGRAPHVEVSAERTADGWLVTVADNGIGVEDASSDRIFTMFERLHPRERFKGTGIGLSICKRIVERRGGTIWVEANEAGGSRFRFSLPDVAGAVAVA